VPNITRRTVITLVCAPLALGLIAGRASAAPVTAGDLRAQLRTERTETAKLRAELRAARTAARPTVDHAIHLAAQAFGVDHAKMRRVARCESTLNPYARNGQYQGLFQTGPAFWRATPFTAFARTDPYANALAAAMVAAREGWGQWPECGLR
jgi:soluble lytic murein transglycosylase-like protein